MTTNTLRTDGTAVPPFYFVVVFWGGEHREYFLRLLAPSMRAPHNVPCLPEDVRTASRFVVVTTAEDWASMQEDEDFRALSETIGILHLEIPHPEEGSNKYLAMSSGHRLATERCFADRALGVFLTPDLVLADGAVRTLLNKACEGAECVLVAALRFTMEGAMEEVSGYRPAGSSQPLVISTRQLAAIALTNMHDELIRYDWDAPCFAEAPHNLFWRAPGGIVTHGFNWAPLLFDYSRMQQHDTETFDNWTMDGDYIHRNLGRDADPAVIDDSDDLLLISFTPAADRPGNLPLDATAPRWWNTMPVLGEGWKLSLVRRMFKGAGVDALKRRIFDRGVAIHAEGATGPDWDRARMRAGHVVRAMYRPAGPVERLAAYLVPRLQRAAGWPFGSLNSLAVPDDPREGIDFVHQGGVGSVWTLALSKDLPGGCWYWEIHSDNMGASPQVMLTACAGVATAAHATGRMLGSDRASWAIRGDGACLHAGQAFTDHGAPQSTDLTLMVAADTASGALWFGRDGDWFGAPPEPGQAGHCRFQPGSPIMAAISSQHGGAGTATQVAALSPDRFRYTPPAGFSSITDRLHDV